MYLPLDRRWPQEEERSYGATRNRRPTAAGYLPIGNVLNWAVAAFRAEQAEILKLNEELKLDILRSLFATDLTRPTQVWTVEDLATRRQSIVGTLQNLGLIEAEDVTSDYFERLAEVTAPIAGRTEPDDIAKDPEFDTWVDWIVEVSPNAAKVEQIVPLVQNYEDRRLISTRRSREFLESINDFLGDSGKQLVYSGPEGLQVELPHGARVDASQLSSGELQILTLFTFLYFRFDLQQVFTIIIDEPELSLHLKWQHRYLESITRANPLAQFIVATHLR